MGAGHGCGYLEGKVVVAAVVAAAAEVVVVVVVRVAKLPFGAHAFSSFYAQHEGFESSKSAWRDDEEAARVGLKGRARDQPCASWGSLSCCAHVRCGAQPGATVIGWGFQKKKRALACKRSATRRP